MRKVTNVVSAKDEDNYNSIVAKIMAEDSFDSKIAVYFMFTQTHPEQMIFVEHLLQVKDLKFYSNLKKMMKPNLFQRVKQWYFNFR